jgi:hypothetical protein
LVNGFSINHYCFCKEVMPFSHVWVRKVDLKYIKKLSRISRACHMKKPCWMKHKAVFPCTWVSSIPGQVGSYTE